jgi:membrane associated rhomboid family serine protease
MINLNTLIVQLHVILLAMQNNLALTLEVLGGLWLIHLFNFSSGYRLNMLGIYPRHLLGLVGIPLHPMLHGSFNHLFFNSIPLFILINFMLMMGLRPFVEMTMLMTLISGIGIWCFGRRGVHIGASSLAMSYWSYLLVSAIKHPSVLTILLAIICLYYLGGMAASLFPQGKRDSWEGHVIGFFTGVGVYYLTALPAFIQIL